MKMVRSVVLLVLGLLFAQMPALAADEKPAKEWGGTVEFSLITATGNSRTETGSSKAKAVRKTEREKWIFRGGGLLAKSDGDKTVERYYANGEYNYYHTAKTYSSYFLGWEKDKPAGLDSRMAARVGLGHEFVKTAKDLFLGEAGVAYVYENKIEGIDGFPEGRLFGNYEHYFREDAIFFQELEWLQDLSMLTNYRINSVTGFKVAINKSWSLRTALTIYFDHEPSQGFRKTDTITETSLVYNF